MKYRFLTAVAALAATVLSLGAQEKLYPQQFNLGDVTLLDGPFKHAQDLNVEVLLEYDMDRLLQPFLKQAGLEPKAEAFPNWEGLDGHIGGHYVSALAIHYAATGNQECLDRLNYMLSELKRCQDANGDGYLGGVPNSDELWPEVKSGNLRRMHSMWVPWYNLHKIYAGLRDAYMYAGSELAKEMFLKLCDWGIGIFGDFSDELFENMLSQEHGGLNEVYADAYAITGDRKYLEAARKLTHHEIFDSMLAGVDNLDNRHANTQVPKIVGYARYAELAGDNDYFKASDFFWESVADHRSVAFGGNSRREHFPAISDYESYMEEREGPESCNTNNMLKLTENLFRIKPDAVYADYYENALYNHILSTQHPQHGGYVYFTPARPSHYRVYSQPNSGMWCCVGTGMENHGKYGEFIYAHDGDDLYVNLFIASELNWKEKGFSLRQDTAFPSEEGTTLTVTSKKKSKVNLLIRCPEWTEGMEVRVNGASWPVEVAENGYVSVSRKWKKGDVVSVALPMSTRIERLENVPDYIAIKRGPILFGVKTNQRDMDGLVSDDGRWAHIAHGPLQSAFDDAPVIVASDDEILAKLQLAVPVEGKPFHFTVPGLFKGEFANAELEPFYGIHDSRYSIYYLCLDEKGYDAKVNEAKTREAERMALDARTIDAVQTGEQQPEIDHRMQVGRSSKGNNQGEAYRQAMGSWFSYELETKGQTELALMLRFWGAESGNRSFKILVDDTEIAAENIASKWNRSAFFNVEYPIPASLLDGKEIITVKFESAGPRDTVGGIYSVRLVKKQ